MIAKIPDKRKDGKSSFYDLVAYCTNPEKAVHVGSQNLSSQDVEMAALEMAALASDNTRCKDPVFHMILAWREMEIPTPKQVDEAVRIALKEIDLQDCQAIWALHADTENLNVHVAANRIDPETGKAIQPANNWTYTALEMAARKIELAQGWEVEQSGRYLVTADGEIKVKEVRDEDAVKLSQTARDIEAHTATKSAERIGQETAAPVIRDARSWEELHTRLAEQGIAFERKGSGAILRIGETVIKASQAGRDISLSKLEERLGAYQEREVPSVLCNPQPEAVERVEAIPKVKKSWEDYQKARTDYRKSKEKAFSDLKERHEKERKSLSETQREERGQLLGVSWKGRGAELNQKRSVLAAVQKAENLNLRDRQKEEREMLKKRFSQRFPNFKTWLAAENDPELSVSFRYPDETPILLEGKRQGESFPPAPVDLRAYTAVNVGKGVAYVCSIGRKKSKEADFIDYGRKILLQRKTDETAVLAALQLAAQKWGAVQINGTEEYKQLCVRMAIEHNLKIANPDLAREVEAGRRRIAEEKEGEKMRQEELKKAIEENKKTLFGRYADAVGAERFRITVTEITEEGTRAFLFDRQNGGKEGKTREEILAAIPQFDKYVYYGKNIIVTPMSHDKHHILVDDLTPEKLRQLEDDGYSPACVIESSPDNFQAVITVPSADGDTAKDRAAANKLTRELNQKYGDPNLSGSVHGHRLPPFPNQKPKHRREDGSYPETVLVEAPGGFCEKAAAALAAIRAEVREAEKKAREAEERGRACYQGRNAYSAGDPSAAYWLHYEDVMKRRRGKSDYSQIDGIIGIRMRVAGYNPSQVMSAIEENAPMMRKQNMSAEQYAEKYRGRDWRRYARETTEQFVFGPRGVSQYAQAESYRPYYLNLEGRNAREGYETREKDLGR
jgi:hypothetical protein